MSLSSQLSTYNFSPEQTNLLSAPASSGANFGDINMVYSRNNATSQGSFGLSTREEESFDAANYQMFNPTLSLGVDCSALNSSAGRPNQDQLGVSACYPASPSAQKAAFQLDARYNTSGPSASQIVLAQGDILYAPSRFADQNNYISPEMSDYTFQPRLMGTRDNVSPGCVSTGYGESIGNSEYCALQGDLSLPYNVSSDPRTMYGVDEPRSGYWESLVLGGGEPKGCFPMQFDQTQQYMCNVNQVEPGAGKVKIPPQYKNKKHNRP